mgnify:CR=1 FL=1|tara:strand:- start:64 stop:393 length:330 start_codon:yes stop_codon:yes gene_type:complete
MLYISAAGEYPRHVGDVQLVKKTFKDGETLPKGWQAVVETERPEAGADQVAYDSGAVDLDGVLSQGWTVRDLTAAEIERRDAPANAKAKLETLGFTEAEIQALISGLVR